MKKVVLFFGTLALLISFAFISNNTQEVNVAHTALHNHTQDVCPDCNGVGNRICTICNGDRYIKVFNKCTVCKGERMVDCTVCDGEGTVQCEIDRCINGYITYPCWSCDGKSAEVRENCNTCKGKGTVTEMCNLCKGKGEFPCKNCRYGRVQCYECLGHGGSTNEYPCSNCSGAGYKKCERCKGSGEVN